MKNYITPSVSMIGYNGGIPTVLAIAAASAVASAAAVAVSKAVGDDKLKKDKTFNKIED